LRFAEIITEKIDKIPPLPDTVVEIENICNNENSTVQDIVKIVEIDPILTAKILKVANSPYYGFTSKITNITDAVALLGINTILTFAMETALKNQFQKIDLTPYSLSVENFMQSSFKQKRLMILWHVSLNLKKSDSLIPASFLSDLGKLIIAEIIAESGLEKEFSNKIKNAKNIDEILKLEKEYIGYSSLETTARILYKWRFNINVILPIIGAENPEMSDETMQPYSYALKIVKVAIGLQGIITKNSLKDALALLDKTNFTVKDFLIAVNRLK
jgi:HD-like signal output (HDOD) protein